MDGAAALPGLGARFLRTLRTGALVGLGVGVVLALTALVLDDSGVTFAAYGITLAIAAIGLGIGLILWLAAAAFSRISSSYVKVDAPLSRQRMVLDRVILGAGAAGAVACLLVAAVALAQGERLF